LPCTLEKNELLLLLELLLKLIGKPLAVFWI